MAKQAKSTQAYRSLRRAISTPTFALLAGGAVGGYVLPRWVQGVDTTVGALTGAAMAVLVTAIF